jgi:RecB family exonuclease
VTLRGIADRIDVLDGDRLRIVDYKLGRAPDVRRAVQLPVYAVQACQQLAAQGHAPRMADAAYLAFGERNPYVPLTSRGVTLDAAIVEGQRRALQAIDGIELGAFPPRPADAFQCGYCPYAMVCRKDYVDGD